MHATFSFYNTIDPQYTLGPFFPDSQSLLPMSERLRKLLPLIQGDFTTNQISIYCELWYVAARGWRGGFATSMLINVGKVLLMSSDFIKSVFCVHTHTQLLAKRHGPAWSIRVQILFFTHFYMLSPSQDPHRNKKKKEKKYLTSRFNW